MNSPETTQGFPGRWWTRLDDERILCELCPRACVLKDGDRGFCFVRQNLDGQMILTTYGKSTGFCIDPVEKKPLNHFLPGTSVLSFGTAGCNLGCRFCQNWEISKSREIESLSESASPGEIAAQAQSSGSRSVAFTYNDPVIWAEYAMDTARACHERNIKTIAVTAGYIMPEARREFYSVIDAANVDLKAFSELFYQQVTLSSLAPILETLRWLKEETDVWFEITTLLIPTKNDSAEEIDRMCDWLINNLGDSVPLHFTAFHPDFRMQDIPATPAATLIRARQQALGIGLKHVYTGNVHDKSGQSTYCPQCKLCLIERDWFTLGQFNIENGCCKFCGQQIAGVYENEPGTWGAQRMPVFFSK